MALRVALSPDGTRLAYVASQGGTQQLYLRAMDSLEARPVRGTDGAVEPFFSPDGQGLGFFAGGKLKKVSVSGGAALPLGDASNPIGASWGSQGTIAFGPSVDRSSASVGHGRCRAVADSSRERRDRPPVAGVLAGRQGRALWCLGGCRLTDRRPVDRDGRPADPDPRRNAAAVCAVRTPDLCARGEPDGRAVRSPAAHPDGRDGPVVEEVSCNLSTPVRPVQRFRSRDRWSMFRGLQAAPSRLVWVDRKGLEQALPAPPRAIGIRGSLPMGSAWLSRSKNRKVTSG